MVTEMAHTLFAVDTHPLFLLLLQKDPKIGRFLIIPLSHLITGVENGGVYLLNRLMIQNTAGAAEIYARGVVRWL